MPRVGSELKSRYRKDLLFLDATDRGPERTDEVAAQIDIDAAEVEAAGAAVAARS